VEGPGDESGLRWRRCGARDLAGGTRARQRGDGAPGVRLGQGYAMEMQSSPWSAAECRALVRAPEDLAEECGNTRRRGSVDSRRSALG